jgi:hypothetical protein
MENRFKPLGRIVSECRVPIFGPKAQQFAQPRATPWGRRRINTHSPAQRANSSPGEPLARWAVDGRVVRSTFPQGVALGWENRCPVGAASAAKSEQDPGARIYPNLTRFHPAAPNARGTEPEEPQP